MATLTTIVSHLRTAVELVTAAPWETVAAATITPLGLVAYVEYRRRTRTTPTLRARAGAALNRAWKSARTPTTQEQKDRRGDRIELALVTFFIVVVAGLIMHGLVDFARDSMSLTGVWPYLLFAAFDGAAGLFAFASYRWALKHGASPLFPRAMVALILAGSAWFQWTHAAAADNPPAGQVAWAALPAIGAVLWEFVLRQRMKTWKTAQPPRTEAIPRARWILAPLQSALMKRRMVLWGTSSYETAVELHVTRVESIRRLRRRFGPLWARRVPADVAYRLRAGVRIPEAAARVDEILATPAPRPSHLKRSKASKPTPVAPQPTIPTENGTTPTEMGAIPDGLNEDVIRLYVTSQQRGETLSYSQIARQTGVPKSTVGRHIKTYRDLTPMVTESS